MNCKPKDCFTNATDFLFLIKERRFYSLSILTFCGNIIAIVLQNKNFNTKNFWMPNVWFCFYKNLDLVPKLSKKKSIKIERKITRLPSTAQNLAKKQGVFKIRIKLWRRIMEIGTKKINFEQTQRNAKRLHNNWSQECGRVLLFSWFVLPYFVK